MNVSSQTSQIHLSYERLFWDLGLHSHYLLISPLLLSAYLLQLMASSDITLVLCLEGIFHVKASNQICRQFAVLWVSRSCQRSCCSSIQISQMDCPYYLKSHLLCGPHMASVRGLSGMIWNNWHITDLQCGAERRNRGKKLGIIPCPFLFYCKQMTFLLNVQDSFLFSGRTKSWNISLPSSPITMTCLHKSLSSLYPYCHHRQKKNDAWFPPFLCLLACLILYQLARRNQKAVSQL